MRKNLRIFVYALLFLPAASARADFPKSVAELCRAVHPSHAPVSSSREIHLRDRLRLLLTPRSRWVGVDEYESGQFVPALPTGDSADRKLVVFTLGPGYHPDESERALVKATVDVSEKQRRNFDFLKKNSTAETCVQVGQTRLGLADSTVEEDYRRIDVALQIQIKEERAASYNIAEDTKLHGRSSTLIPLSTLADFHPAFEKLQSEGTPFDMVLILHGTPEGYLVTADGKILPPRELRFLAGVSGLKNLAFFNCYPRAIARAYAGELTKLEAAGKRLFVSNNRISELLALEDTATVLQLLPEFLAKVSEL